MPLEKDWMLHPPFNVWPHSIVGMIKYLTQVNCPQEKIIEAVKSHPPKGGWNPTTKQYALIAIELMAEAEKEGGKDGEQ